MAGLPDEAERDAWVILSRVHGVGPVSFERLARRFGSVGAVLDRARRAGAIGALVASSTDETGSTPTLTADAAAAVVAAACTPGTILEPVRRAGVTVLTLADEAYPSRLRRIDLPPPVLYLRGDVTALDRHRAVAIVGTRRPTDAGRALAAQVADAVSGLGATVVSGLALGIDGAAHIATVRSGRVTVAVIGGGHERLYPSAHRGLATSIVARGGAVISEFAPDVIPTRGTFPRRNRIISGLADATVVVEAGLRSGALTTAAWALEQGRGLHLVPGRIGDPTVAGCLAFLREAAPEARVVAGVPELLEDLGLLAGAPAGSSGTGSRQLELDAVLASLGPVERTLARRIGVGGASLDELEAATRLPGATLLGALTALEVRGLVIEAFGRYRPAGPLAIAGRTTAGGARPAAGGRGRAA